MGYKDPLKQAEYQNNWMKSRRMEYLKDKACVRCDDKEGLEIDHIDPRLKISHRIWSWSAERQLKELAKCQVLCSECHKAKSRLAYSEPKHGTSTRYKRYKCRCSDCRKWKSVENARRYLLSSG